MARKSTSTNIAHETATGTTRLRRGAGSKTKENNVVIATYNYIKNLQGPMVEKNRILTNLVSWARQRGFIPTNFPN